MFFLGAQQICGVYISSGVVVSTWPQAEHLHTSAESSVLPAASLSSPEVLSDLFTCSPHFTQAKKKGR